MVSFLPEDKEPSFLPNGNWATTDRQTGKPGKIIRKALKKSFKNSELEQFVYKLKALWSDRGYELSLVSGEQIRYFYNEKHYYECSNTLGNSCMSHTHCQDFFDLYVEQPECQMLIALKDDLLAARALVWTIGDITFMDRCYYIEDCLLNVFINYAKEHEWLIRDTNGLLSDGESQYFLGPKDNYQNAFEGDFKLVLKRNYKQMPYIDTFRYYSISQGCLYTSNKDCTERCSFTDGRFEESSFECPFCGAEYDDGDDVVYSDYDNCDCCTSCATWCDCIESWVVSDVVSLYKGSQRWIYDYAPVDHVINNPNQYTCIDGKWYINED